MSNNATFGKILESLEKHSANVNLNELQDSFKAIRDQVPIAERLAHLGAGGSNAVKELLARLNKLLYITDDFLNEVAVSSGNLGDNLSLVIRSIKEDLDGIVLDFQRLDLTDRLESPILPITQLMHQRETCSFIPEDHRSIFRESDVENIVEMLCNPKYDLQDGVSVIPIVGFWGIGKTALAQMVFNDARIKGCFNFTKWVWLPCIDGRREVMETIFQSFNGEATPALSLGKLRSDIEYLIESRKFLIVLDDLWDVRIETWVEFMNLMACGSRRSRVIVTTRSDVIATAVGTTPNAYKLGPLTDEDSWRFLKSVAFDKGGNIDPILFEMGKEISKGCGNIPAVLKDVGNRLCGEEVKTYQQLLRDVKFSEIKLPMRLMLDLQLSYDYLSPQLKQCLTFCSLFLKDYKFSKVELVRLWIAQGYVEQGDNKVGMEDKGCRYFQELVNSGFFQDVEQDVSGENRCCKLNRFVLPLLEHVAGDENILVDDGTTWCTDRAIHAGMHLDFGHYSSSWKVPQALLVAAENLRSLVIRRKHPYGFSLEASTFEEIIAAFPFIRVLDLESMKITMIPKSMGRLRHLRSLNISRNLIKSLPDTVTSLVNLQTLNLNYCESLREWPRNFTKLANLRHLGILGCPFSDMPLRFGEMKSLTELSRFIVGKGTGLDTLTNLSLRGELFIEFLRWRKNAVSEAKKAGLFGKLHLVCLTLDLGFKEEQTAPTSNNMELMLECFTLPASLTSLHILKYGGEELLPGLVDMLPNIVRLRIEHCHNCETLPPVSRLYNLKSLCLGGLEALVCIEDNHDDPDGSALYFPSLESLEMWWLPKLKQWSRVEEKQLGQPRSFPRLSQLNIRGCHELMSMPLVPRLESLKADKINDKLLKSLLSSYQETASSSSSSTLPTLKRFETRFFTGLRSFSSDEIPPHLFALEKFKIEKCEVLSDEGARLVWQGLKSIRSLIFSEILYLKALPKEITLLTTLESLEISSLHSLATLPEHIGNLSQLREVRISGCSKLASLPQSVRTLPNLILLEVRNCPALQRRCQQPNGEDWPLIEHIPHVSV